MMFWRLIVALVSLLLASSNVLAEVQSPVPNEKFYILDDSPIRGNFHIFKLENFQEDRPVFGIYHWENSKARWERARRQELDEIDIKSLRLSQMAEEVDSYVRKDDWTRTQVEFKRGDIIEYPGKNSSERSPARIEKMFSNGLIFVRYLIPEAENKPHVPIEEKDLYKYTLVRSLKHDFRLRKSTPVNPQVKPTNGASPGKVITAP